MERNEILSKVDHTLLAQTATWAEIRAICDDGMKYHTASVCIPASYVKQAKDYVGGKLAICTVIGFPNGYDTTKAKCFEATDAVENGADEVDMVINIGWVKDRRWGDLLEEIRAVKAACQGKLLKVIIETCLLTDDEKIKMCEIVSASGADYIKTSTGFSTGGATFHDVELFAKHVKPGVKIKAAGGISSLDDAEKFIELGASRLGTSRVVKIVKKLEAEEKKPAYPLPHQHKNRKEPDLWPTIRHRIYTPSPATSARPSSCPATRCDPNSSRKTFWKMPFWSITSAASTAIPAHIAECRSPSWRPAWACRPSASIPGSCLPSSG